MTRVEDLGQHLRVVNGSSSELEIALAAFPPYVAEDVAQVISRLQARVHPTSLGAVVIRLGADNVEIPGRIYRSELTTGDLHRLNPVQTQVVHCLYTRSHDGHVRERSLTALLESAHDLWSIPFVLRLVGEYVKEICEIVAEHAPSENVDMYGAVADANPELMRWIRQSVVSYWACYWRRSLKLHEYPGYRALLELNLWRGREGRKVLRNGGW